MIQLQLIPLPEQVLAAFPYPASQDIEPHELADLSLPPEVDLRQPIILFGQVPQWVYGCLVNLCREVPVLACFQASLGAAVVIHSRRADLRVGDPLPIALRSQPAPAVLVGGPPDSGKSVFSNALRLSLMRQYPQCQVYLYRANWDGEGNWSHEASNQSFVKGLVQQYERRIHEQPKAAERMRLFFEFHGEAVANLRKLVDLVIVDVGGLCQEEKQPVLEQCTHYIVVSRDPDRIPEWRRFCEPTLEPLSLIYSVRDSTCEVLRTEPVLEVRAGPWQRGVTQAVPEEIVRVVRSILNMD